MYGFLRGLYACVTGLILRAENYGVVTPFTVFLGIFTGCLQFTGYELPDLLGSIMVLPIALR